MHICRAEHKLYYKFLIRNEFYRKKIFTMEKSQKVRFSTCAEVKLNRISKIRNMSKRAEKKQQNK